MKPIPKLTVLGAAFLLLSTLLFVRMQGSNAVADGPSIELFTTLIDGQVDARTKALTTISENWNGGDAAMMIEAARFTRNRQARAAMMDLVRRKTGKRFNDYDQWYRWIWNQDVKLHPNYASFKKDLYRRIDPRFAEYFSDQYPSTIRLDEIRWGGVRRDGIPPLKDPDTISAEDAIYLNDSDIVFGVSFEGSSRAYPKRILAWHEMVKDHVGGLSINGVYCTLCGSMIIYETEFEGNHYELGTSGFLYRSNKLMYDHETKSMWSTLKGEPVVGPLVGKGINLKSRYVVTTTWGQWKADHPDTDVLSLKTGHRRDYGEGVAYRDYFSTDELMFTVPKIDQRLKNKDEVLIIREGGEPVAIAASFLAKHPVYHDKNGDVEFVVVTDPAGANRVYESSGVMFERFVKPRVMRSSDGILWKVTEAALVSEDGTKKRKRLSAHRAFWFGWHADHPNVRLIK